LHRDNSSIAGANYRLPSFIDEEMPVWNRNVEESLKTKSSIINDRFGFQVNGGLKRKMWIKGSMRNELILTTCVDRKFLALFSLRHIAI
jgi:hypothetical protein